MRDAASIARDWIGTPYVHQARCKGAGCDCLGLLLGVWQEMGGSIPKVPAYSFDWSEASGQEQLLTALKSKLVRCEGHSLERGQVLLFRMREGAVAKHLGIISEAGRAPQFIHAYTGHGVVESPLSQPWLRRIAARFSLPVTL